MKKTKSTTFRVPSFPLDDLNESLKILNWDGYTEPLIQYLYKLYRICMDEYLMEKNVIKHTILRHTMNLLSVIYYFNIDSVTKFDKIPAVRQQLKELEKTKTTNNYRRKYR